MTHRPNLSKLVSVKTETDMETTQLLAERLLTVKQVADILSIGKSTVWAKVKSNDLPPPIQIGGKTTRWRMSEIQAVIQKQ